MRDKERRVEELRCLLKQTKKKTREETGSIIIQGVYEESRILNVYKMDWQKKWGWR